MLLGFVKGNQEPILKVIGEPIPSSLVTGPDPSADEGKQMHVEDGELIVSDEMKWIVDFDEAVSKGMGFKIDLTPAQAENGFDRLFVLGVRLSADKEKAKTSVENLIDHHHHSRKGFSILSQGTPTNNTEKEASTYSWREDSDESFDIYFRKESPDDPVGWLEKKDGRWLAEMLGTDTKCLENVANYYGTDQCEAKAMNVALWPATLGYFMETMMAPVFQRQSCRSNQIILSTLCEWSWNDTSYPRRETTLWYIACHAFFTHEMATSSYSSYPYCVYNYLYWRWYILFASTLHRTKKT